MLPGIQHSMAGTSAKSECVVHSLILDTTIDCLCGGEWRSLRTDREAGPAELSYCDITLNTSFITFQVEESGCGGGH